MILIRKFLVYYSIPVQVNLDEIVEFMSGIGFVPNFLYSKLNDIRMLVINRVVMFYVNKKLLLTTVPVPIFSKGCGHVIQYRYTYSSVGEPKMFNFYCIGTVPAVQLYLFPLISAPLPTLLLLLNIFFNKLNY